MSTRIFIKGNFLIARSDLNNNSFIRVPKSDVIPFRDEFDNFGFFDRNTLARIEGFQKLTQLGRIEEWNIDNEFPPSQTVFPFSDIVDELGAPYLSADDLDSLLLTNLGACATGGGGGGITYVATDATLSGDGTPGFPLHVEQASGLPTKSGIELQVAFSGTPKRALVVFATPFASNLYSPVLVCETINNTTYVPKIDTITANGFAIDMSVNNINNLVSVRWIAVLNGETV